MHMMYVTITWYGTLLQREKKNGWSLPGTLAGAIIEKIIKCKLNVTPVLNSIRYKLHMINGTYIDEQKKLLIIIFMYICVLILEG